jgi:hypothetical protein
VNTWWFLNPGLSYFHSFPVRKIDRLAGDVPELSEVQANNKGVRWSVLERVEVGLDEEQDSNAVVQLNPMTIEDGQVLHYAR